MGFRRRHCSARDRSNSDSCSPGHLISPRSFVQKKGFHMPVAMGKRTSDNNGRGLETSGKSSISAPLVIAMVGLPARGKTYISKKLSRYLNWIGINTRVFNLGDYRRQMNGGPYTNHEIFSSDNAEGLLLREKVCQAGLDDVIDWLSGECPGEVAVFDATNTTKARRKYLYETVVKKHGFKLFFVESICDNEDIIASNIINAKVTSPDYSSFEATKSVINDFRLRISHYECLYETLDEQAESNYSFVKIFNAGEKVLVHKYEGHIQSRIVYYLMNIRITPRTIYICRHGESMNNLKGIIGGDSKLSIRGEEFSRRLASYVNALELKNLLVWTSHLQATIQTTSEINGIHERWITLNDIDCGVCDGKSYAEIRNLYPEDFKARDADKFRFRYTRGESYEDLVARLEPVIMELERQDQVLVVAHQAVIRCLLAYYTETGEEELPWMEVPLHTITKLTPVAYGCMVENINLDVDCVNTHRPRPNVPGFLDKRFRKLNVVDESQAQSVTEIKENKT